MTIPAISINVSSSRESDKVRRRGIGGCGLMVDENRRARFEWNAEDITVRDSSGKLVDISKKPVEEPTPGKDVNPKVPEEK